MGSRGRTDPGERIAGDSSLGTLTADDQQSVEVCGRMTGYKARCRLGMAGREERGLLAPWAQALAPSFPPANGPKDLPADHRG